MLLNFPSNSIFLRLKLVAVTLLLVRATSLVESLVWFIFPLRLAIKLNSSSRWIFNNVFKEKIRIWREIGYACYVIYDPCLSQFGNWCHFGLWFFLVDHVCCLCLLHRSHIDVLWLVERLSSSHQQILNFKKKERLVIASNYCHNKVN